MAENYYPDTDTDASEDSPPADRENSDKPDVETTLVPVSFLGGGDKEVGSVCKVKIVALHDGEAEIRYVKHDKDSDEDDDDSGKDPREMSVADSMMSDT